MGKKNFLQHFFTIGIGTFLNLIIGLLTTPIITRIVSPVEYGQLSIFNMYASIAMIVFCFGLDQSLVRYYYEKKDFKYKKKLLMKCIKIPLLISTIFCFLFILCLVFNVFSFEFDLNITILLSIYIIIQIINRFSILILRLEYNSKLYSKLNVLLKIFYIAIALPLLLLIKKNYFILLCIATVLSTLVCTIISILNQKQMWKFIKYEDTDNIVNMKEIIKYAYPYVFSMGITTLFQAIDKFSLKLFCNYSEVGIYSSAMSLVHVFAIVQTTFNALWSPMAVEHYTNNPEDKKFYQKGNSVITVIMFSLGITLILFKDVFSFLLGEEYRQASYILPFLIFNPIMYTISETTVNGLVFKKKSKMQVVVAIGACLTNLVGNLILVPKLGCKGAAISTGISYIVFFSLRTFLSNRYFYIDFKLKKIALIILLTSLYAFYNTFFEFGFLNICGYIFLMIILIFTYKKTVIYILSYVKRIIMSKIISK